MVSTLCRSVRVIYLSTYFHVTELLAYGGGVQGILLLPLVTRCLETIDVCIWGMLVFALEC